MSNKNKNVLSILNTYGYVNFDVNTNYLSYKNGLNKSVYVVLLKQDETSNFVIVDCMNFNVFEKEADILLFLNPLMDSFTIDSSEDKELLDSLKPIIFDDFQKLVFKIKSKAEIISSYFVYESELNEHFPYFIRLDDSLNNNGGEAVLFNEVNYINQNNGGYNYKSIKSDSDTLFITANPFVFAVYNAEGDNNSVLFAWDININYFFNVLSKYNNKSLNNIHIGAANNLNDQVFLLKYLIGNYNVTVKEIFSVSVEPKQTTVSFSFLLDKKEEVIKSILAFGNLIGKLNKNFENRGIEYTDDLAYQMPSYNLDNLSVKQIVIPNKVEFLEAFNQELISTFKLENITIHKDLSFSSSINNEEEEEGMFTVNE